MGRPHFSDFATQVFVKVLALFPNFDKRRARRTCSRWKCVLSKKLAIMRQLFLPINESVVMKDELLSAYMDCCICEEEALRSYTEHKGTSYNGPSRTMYYSKHASKAYNDMPYKSKKSRVASRRLSEISRIISRSNRSPVYTPESRSSDLLSYHNGSSPRRHSKDSRHPEGPNFIYVTNNEESSSTSHKNYIRPSQGRDNGISYKAASNSSLIEYPSEQPMDLASPPESGRGSWTNSSTDEPNDRIAHDVGLDSSDMVRNYNHRNDTTFRSHGLRYYGSKDKSSGRDSPSTNILYAAAAGRAPLSLSCATCTTGGPEFSPTSRSPYRSTSYHSDMSNFRSSKRRDFTDDESGRNETYASHHQQKPHYPRESDDSRESRHSKHYERLYDGPHSSKYPPEFKSLGQPQSHRYSPTHGHHRNHAHHDVLRGKHKGRGYIEHRFHRRKPKEKRFQPHDIEPYLKHSDDDTQSKHQESTRSRLDNISNIAHNPKVQHIRTSRNYSHRTSRGPSSKRVVVKKRKRSRK